MIIKNLLSNWPYKLLSLGVAIILTLYVHSERNPWISTTTTATLHMENLTKGYTASLALEEVGVALEGPEYRIRDLKPGDIRASVDLTHIEAGSHTLPIKVSIPENLARSVAARPATPNVQVTVEAITARTIPIEVKVKNSPPIGWASGAPSITPAAAEVSGGSNVVSRVSRLLVTVEVTPRNQSVNEEVPIIAVDAKGNRVTGATISPTHANVSMKLVQAPANKELLISPTITGQPQHPYKITKINASPDRVEVSGNASDLIGTSTISTDVIDVSGATGDVVRQVNLRVPSALKVSGGRRVRVIVRIESRELPSEASSD